MATDLVQRELYLQSSPKERTSIILNISIVGWIKHCHLTDVFLDDLKSSSLSSR